MEKAREYQVHRPVMLKEVLELLRPAPGETFLDLTVGAGGHAAELARRVGRGGLIVGMDLDSSILEVARKTLGEPGMAASRLFHGNFVDCREALEEAGVESVDGILLDLGVSSLQIDDARRGFSFMREGPLDMRMDADSDAPSAADIVNHAGRDELERIFREYGEERHARLIARLVVEGRQKGRIESTGDLAAIAVKAWRRPGRWRIHPATRVFQALRIEVNGELRNLKELLLHAPELLGQGGRIAVISFHSLEDRIVKEDFRGRAAEGVYRRLTKKPLQASEEEVGANPRSRSAKLRAAQRSVQ